MIDQSDVSYLEYHGRKSLLYLLIPTFPIYQIEAKVRSQNILSRSSPMTECKQITKKIMASPNAYICYSTPCFFFFALKATNLSITADELQMTYFKCKSLRKVIIVVTAHHFLVFLTLCSQLKFSENPGKNRFEPERILTGTQGYFSLNDFYIPMRPLREDQKHRRRFTR